MPTPVSLGGNGAGVAATSIALTATSAIQAGDLVIVVAGDSSNNLLTSVTDNGGNTYQRADGSLSGTQDCELYYAFNCSPVASPVITANFAGSSASRLINAARCPGIATSAPLDKHNNAGATTNSPTVSTAVLSQASEVVFGAVYVNNAPSLTPSAGFTQLLYETLSGNVGLDLEYQVVSSTAAVTYNPALGASVLTNAVIASFLVAGPAAGFDMNSTSIFVLPFKALGKSFSGWRQASRDWQRRGSGLLVPAWQF